MLARRELIGLLRPVFSVFEALFPALRPLFSDIDERLARARTVTHPVRSSSHLGKPLSHILDLRDVRGAA
jgi:hypothetical protein